MDAHFFSSENISNLSAKLHSYSFRLWSNCTYGTGNAFFGRYFRPKKAKERTIMSSKNNNQWGVPRPVTPATLEGSW